jgi:hypothetical protein
MEMTFNSFLKTANVLGLLVLIVLGISYQAKAEEQDNYVECQLNDDNECVVETETLEKETVEEKTPKKFEDSTITRKTKDGKTVTLDGDKYKIVPRKQTRYRKKVKKQVVRPIVINEKKHHNISLLVGYGPDADISRRTITPNRDVELTHESSLQLGLSYDYLDVVEITDDMDLSLGLQIQTNESAFGRVGISF